MLGTSVWIGAKGKYPTTTYIRHVERADRKSQAMAPLFSSLSSRMGKYPTTTYIRQVERVDRRSTGHGATIQQSSKSDDSSLHKESGTYRQTQEVQKGDMYDLAITPN